MRIIGLSALVLCLAGTVFGQARPDYAREPLVVEQMTRRAEFQNDGTGTLVTAARIHLNSDAGVRALGQLVFGYNSANERVEIGYVRVRKPDGQVVVAPSDAVQDLSTAISRMAPAYTDYRQKHVTVPALRPGDSLEYSVSTVVHTPVAPGQFWLSHTFDRNRIVLDERLEVSVPQNRPIKLKTSEGHDAAMSEEGGRRIYRWASSHKVREDEEAKKPKSSKKEEQADVQLTTFANWQEVGEWYAALEKGRRSATPEIRAKAAEITRGRSTEMERLEAIYDYVAKSFRYVSLSFGAGRPQPHTAAEVLANQYGDCKDKHTLLAALADAAGLHASAVLISSTRKLDPEIPSPAQFDHMISMVGVGKEEVWLDTTTEVAPFRLLSPQLRKKQALVVPASGPSRLMETPADAPFPSRQTVDVEGSIDALGKLTLRLRHTFRGDAELPIRMAFRRMPATQWKALVQKAASSDVPGSEVGELQVGDPAATREPYVLAYQLTRAGFLDWSKKDTSLEIPLPSLTVPWAAEDTEDAVEINPTGEQSQRLKLELPQSYTVRLPVPLAVTRDYGEYRSTYRIEGHVVTVERKLTFRQPELPAARVGDYLAFRRAVVSDLAQTLSVETSVAANTNGGDAKLSAKELAESGTAALNNSNYQAAADLLKRAVELEPKHRSAWNNLGNAYFGLRRFDDAVAAYRKQLDANPYDARAYNNLGLAFWRVEKYDDALAAFRKQLEISPLDRPAHRNLGALLVERHRYAEGVSELEKAASLDANDALSQARLGDAYLNTGHEDKALAAFARAADLAPTPVVWSTIAASLADRKVNLERAQQYAESAVASAAAVTRNLTLANLRPSDLGVVDVLTSSWDTLGWVLHQRGQTQKGEPYVRAAWSVSQRGETGDHLAQILQARGQKDKAIQTYAQALAADRPAPETRARLTALAGGDNVDTLVARARGELEAGRTLKLGKLAAGLGRADFVILISPSKPYEVKFVSGDEKLRSAAEALRTAAYGFDFPPGATGLVLRRGTLTCAATGECTLLLQVPDDVTSLE